MLHELIRIGQALLVTSGVAGVCFGIPLSLFWLVLKLGTNRNESRGYGLSDGDCFQASVLNELPHDGGPFITEAR
jgi:hypothetical protein